MAGPVFTKPISPRTLREPAPKLSPAQLLIPTSTLYAVDLSQLGKDSRPEGLHYGRFKKERMELDWSYHKIPTKERQELQDEIVEEVLKRVVKECEEGIENVENGNCEEVCTRSSENGEGGGRPLALFTAG